MNKESEILWRQRFFFPEETEWEAEVRISTQASADEWVHRLHVHNMFTPSPAGRKIRRSINKGLIVIQDNCDGFKATIAPRDLGEIDHNMLVGLATVIPLSLPRLHDEVHVKKTQDLDEYGSPAVRVITREISDSNQGMRYNIRRQIINGDSFAHDSTIARKSRNQTDTVQVTLSEGDIITQITHHSKFTWGEDSNPDRNSKYLVNAEALGVFEHISAPTILRSSSGVILSQDSVTHPGLYKYPRPDIDDIEYGRSPNEVKAWCHPYFEGEKTCDDARCRAQWVKCLQQANRKDISYLREQLRMDFITSHCSRFQRDTFEDLVKAGGNTAQEVLTDLLRFHHKASLEMEAELDDEMCLEELLKTLHKLVDRDLWISTDLVHELLDILSNDGPKFYEALNTLGTLLSNVHPDSQAFKRGHEFLEKRFRRFWAKHAADEQSMRRRVRDELPVFRERSQAFRRERIISTGPALRNEYDIRSRCQLPREKQEDEERAVRLNLMISMVFSDRISMN
jgi:hypothetical protein